MYAVIKTGGKQYRVSEGETLKIEKLEVEPGKKVTFKEVLMVADGEKVQVGSPLVEKASVEAKVVFTIKKRPKALFCLFKTFS